MRTSTTTPATFEMVEPTAADVEVAKWDNSDDEDTAPFIRVREVTEHRDPVFSRPRSRRSWGSRFARFRRRWGRFHSARDDDECSGLTAGNATRRPRTRKRSRGKRACFKFGVFVLTLLGIVHVFNYIVGLGPLFWDDGYEYWLENWGRPGHLGDGLVEYPTDFTRDVRPIPCHSHNDYWRRVPLYDAIHYGCIGVEADVWLFGEELLVGHDTASLSHNRTLRSLYVNPLVQILDKMNPQNEFGNATNRGVFDRDPSQTLVLLIDFKNSGRAIWPYVQNHIGALRDRNYLTYFNGQKTIMGAVTVVATGNAPFDLVIANQTYRDIFFDAPLDTMWEEPTQKASPATEIRNHEPRNDQGQGHSGISKDTVFDSTNSYYASVPFRHSIGMLFRGHLTEKQLNKVRGQIAGAKKRGLKARYWAVPGWPIFIRNRIWEVLAKEGVDVLNVDDLRGAARTDWMKNRHGSYRDWKDRSP